MRKLFGTIGVFAVLAVCLPGAAQARFMQVDPVGYEDQNNLYAYVGNDPINNRDPAGTDCVSSNGITTCTTAVYQVSFPTQRGWQDFTTKSENYHFYSTPNHSNQSVDQTRQWVQNNPTPGSPQPATRQGTFNDATPGVSSNRNAISPVMSFTTTNLKSGNPVVVNVTLPGHPLQHGVVVREPTPDGRGGSNINNWGEGTSPLQSPNTPEGKVLGPTINGVWAWPSQAPPTPPKPCVVQTSGGGCN